MRAHHSSSEANNRFAGKVYDGDVIPDRMLEIWQVHAQAPPAGSCFFLATIPRS